MTTPEEQIEALQARLKESEASAAAMRECFSEAMKTVHAYCGQSEHQDSILAKWERALESTSSGKELLTKLERYYRALLFIENDRYTTQRAREVATEALKPKGA